MQINFSNFIKNGFHYLTLTVLMLSVAIFINFKLYSAQALKAEQIASLQDFIKQNPLVIQKSSSDIELKSNQTSKEILIIIEKFMQGYPELKLKSLSLNKKEGKRFLISLSLDATFEDYTNFIEDITLKSPINESFPFVLEINTYTLDLKRYESSESQNFQSTFIIHTL